MVSRLVDLSHSVCLLIFNSNSQLCITIEHAFGMLVHCWSILQTPLNVAMGGDHQIALTMALFKLHNFCISSGSVASDCERQLDILREGGVQLENDRPIDLLHGGHHFDDVVDSDLHGLNHRSIDKRTALKDFVQIQGGRRPPCSKN